MKKQFYKVKQLADQALSRNDKSNGFPDDLTRADQKTEFIKNTCQNVAKKMSSCLLLPSWSMENGRDKAMKKVPEYALAMALKEASMQPHHYDSPLKTCVEKCYETEFELCENTLEMDNLIDTDVYGKLTAIVDKDVPSIAKLKRNVQKICTDRDAAKQKFIQATKQGNTTAAAKLDVLRDELEDCESKLEQSQDALACEMFQFIMKEGDICHDLLKYYVYRQRYFENAISKMGELIIELESIANRSVRKVYGTELKDHLNTENRRIAYPIELCICVLHKHGMEEEGLFRLAGGASKLKRMKLSFDAGCMSVEAALTQDPHVIAGCLKSYLRDLPEPLLTYALYDKWINAVKVQVNEQERLQLIKNVLSEMPREHFENLQYLIQFFHLLSLRQDVNKMSPQNIAIVLAPNLIWMKQQATDGICLNALNATAQYSKIVELLITNCNFFFPGDPKFFVTLGPEFLCNGDTDGIDNRGFDIRQASDSDNGMKRSQSVSSLSDEPQGSPRPAARKRNKPVAPHPPVEREKPPRPAVGPTPIVAATATLPRGRPKVQKETKATETDDLMTQSMSGVEMMRHGPRADAEKMLKSTKESQTTEDYTRPEMETVTEEQKAKEPVVDMKQDMKEKREKFIIGDKPALPDRPAIAAKPALRTFNRNTISAVDSGRYENVSMSSNENLSGDEKTLQHAKVYSTDRKQVATIIQVDKKRERSRDKLSREKENSIEKKNGEISSEEEKGKEDGSKPEARERVVSLQRAASLSDARRPTSLSISGGNGRPERPPKPDVYRTSPSHCRTSSEGQIIDRPTQFKRDSVGNDSSERQTPERPPPFKREVDASEVPTTERPMPIKREGNVTEGVKTVVKPCTSPPPPPVAAKPRTQLPSDSTDF